jgi:hypothetical protein
MQSIGTHSQRRLRLEAREVQPIYGFALSSYAFFILSNVEAWHTLAWAAPPLQVEVCRYPPTQTRGG